MKKNLLGILKLVLALGLGLFIIYLSLRGLSSEGRQQILESFKLANYNWIILSVFLGIFSHLIRSIRWKMLLQPMGYQPSTFSTFLAVMVGYFANLGIPRSGEIARCSILYKEYRIPVDKSFGTVITERSIDMLLFFGLFFATFLFEYRRLAEYVNQNIWAPLQQKWDFLNQVEGLLLVLGLGFLGIIVGLWFARKKILSLSVVQKVLGLFKGVWEGLLSIVKIRRPGLFIFYSFLIWFLYYLMVYVCMQSLPQTVPLSWTASLSILVLGSIGIMVTPGGIGLYPVIVAQTLVLYGISAQSGYGDAMGWITWSAQTIMIIVVGAISLILVSIKKKASKNESLPQGKI